VPHAQNEFRDRMERGEMAKEIKEYADCKNVVCAWGKLHEFNQMEKREDQVLAARSPRHGGGAAQR
jgi:hypothetical protein